MSMAQGAALGNRKLLKVANRLFTSGPGATWARGSARHDRTQDL